MDLVLRGARLVDGTGTPARAADVGIDDGRIAAVGAPGELPAGTGRADVIELDWLVLAPGFVDIHTHFDAQELWDPDLTPSSWHGVTTVVVGNCGFGIAPTRPEHRATIMRTLENVEGMPLAALEEGIRWEFESFPEYLDVLEHTPTRVNVAVLAGHTALRFFVMGEGATERTATFNEVARMRALLSEAMTSGALGFSTSRSTSHIGAYGLPVPSRAADLHEVWELAGVLKEHGRGVVEAAFGPDLHVDECAQLSDDIGRPVSWAAIVTLERDPALAADLVRRVEARDGQVYPQITCRPIVVQIALSDPFPFANVPSFGEILSLPHAERAARYADERSRADARSGVRAAWG